MAGGQVKATPGRNFYDIKELGSILELWGDIKGLTQQNDLVSLSSGETFVSTIEADLGEDKIDRGRPVEKLSAYFR